MLTPQELREHKDFEKAVFGGYNMEDVDNFLAAVTEDYSALYKENAVLKSQMKVVVDRLEAYRKQEDSMNKAMIAAQQNADELVAETERKCARMLSDSEQLMRTRKSDLEAELEEDYTRVQEAKKAASEFIAEIQLQVQRCQGQLERLRSAIGADDAEPGEVRSARELPLPETSSAGSSEQKLSRKSGRNTPSLSEEIDLNVGRILEELASSRDAGSEAAEHTENS